jgi:elongation factor P
MASIVVQDIRNGTAFLLDGQPWLGLKYEHIKMGRGSATIKIKMRNLLTGATVEKAFVNSAKVEEVNLVRRPMQYLYKDDSGYVFMDPRSFEQAAVPAEVVGEQGVYLKDGIEVNVLWWDDRPLWVELPSKMAFTVAECDPGVKGNTVSNIYKAAKLDIGVIVKVPLFINEGDEVVVDTRDGSYVERVKA